MNVHHLLNGFRQALVGGMGGQLDIFFHGKFTKNPFILKDILDALEGHFLCR